jgi:hypothetical protein
MSQPFGTPASSVGSTGCSFGIHTEPAPASLWPGREGAAGQGCGSLSGRKPAGSRPDRIDAAERRQRSRIVRLASTLKA